MKTFIKVLIILIILIGYSCISQRPYSQSERGNYYQQDNTSYQLFYDYLSPYGQWVRNQEYGYVWIPNTGRNFSPYLTGGRWVLTDYGWTWYSDYSWGWAPFHYGRWDYDNYYGWFWVPGDEWGPSWVIWRRADGYYGWTPMRPGININMSITGGTRDVDRWNFVRENDLNRPDLNRRYLDRSNNEMIFRNSTVINNTYIDNSRRTTYISGPRADDVQRAAGRRIQTVPVRDADRPGSRLDNSQLRIYRPRVQQSADRQVAPRQVKDPEEVRTVNERSNVIRKRSQVQQRSQSQDVNQSQEQERENDQIRQDNNNPVNSQDDSNVEKVKKRRVSTEPSERRR